MPTIPALNDGSSHAPALRVYINMGNVDTLPAYSVGPQGDAATKLKAIAAAGYSGTQGGDVALSKTLGLGCAGGAMEFS
jgi:hypothetical protein